MAEIIKTKIQIWAPWAANLFIALLVFANQGWMKIEIEAAVKNCITRNEFTAYILNRTEMEKINQANLNERLGRIEAMTRAIPELQRGVDQINFELKSNMSTLRKDVDEVQKNGSPITRDRLTILEQQMKALQNQK